MDKVIEIMSERLNAFGVAETLVRKKGDKRLKFKFLTGQQSKTLELLKNFKNQPNLNLELLM